MGSPRTVRRVLSEQRVLGLAVVFLFAAPLRWLTLADVASWPGRMWGVGSLLCHRDGGLVGSMRSSTGN